MFSFDNFDAQVKQTGVTKAFLAKRISKHPTVFHDWAKGKSSPSEMDLKVIAACLGCTASYLKGESDNPQVEVIPADPEKVNAHEEQRGEERKQSWRDLAAILAEETDPEWDQPPRDNYEDMARRIKKLPRESQIRVLDYIELLENQDKG